MPNLTEIPYDELAIPSIAQWATEHIPMAPPWDRALIAECVVGLFDAEQERVVDSIRALGILLCDNPSRLPTA